MCSEAVLNYLKSTNRPYSANDILQNLHNSHSKSAIQKALDDLTEKGYVKEKTYGKQKVYCVVQPDELQDDTEMDNLNQMIMTKSEELKFLEQELKSVEVKILNLTSQPTTEEAARDNERLKKLNMSLLEKLNKLKSGGCLIPQKDLDKVKTTLEKVTKECRKRKRWIDDLLNTVLENYPKSKKALVEEIGLEL